MKVYRIILRILIGMFIYMGFIQPKVWKYTIEILKPRYLRLDRMVLIEGVILNRENIIKSPADGIILKLREEGGRVASGEIVGVIFPDMETYKNYTEGLNGTLMTYKKMNEEREALIKQKDIEIENTYKELSQKADICSSLIANKKDASEVIKELDQLNRKIAIIKKEIGKLKLEIDTLSKEKDRKIKDLKERIITVYTPIYTDTAGILSFSSDSKEGFRNDIIGGRVNLGISIHSIFEKFNTISNGDIIKKDKVIGRIIDNLESFAVCNVTLDGKASFSHNRVEIKDGENLILDIIKLIPNEGKETWICKIVGNFYNKDMSFSKVAKIGEIEGVSIPRRVILKDERGHFVNIIEEDKIKKRYIELLGGNQDWVVVGNIDGRTQVLTKTQ
jgi:hypothetical protein